MQRTIEKYSKNCYEICKNFTQGCIIPIIPEFNINTKDAIAILIIENACNLESDENRIPREKVEYILLYDAKKFIDDLNNYLAIQEFIQNRRFYTEVMYLPPHVIYEKYPDGFQADCTDSGFITFKILEKYKLDKYVCVIPPFRDYIKNKYLYFKLIIPLDTISDDNAFIWMIKRELKEGQKSFIELDVRFRPKKKPAKITQTQFRDMLDDLIQKGEIKKNGDDNYILEDK